MTTADNDPPKVLLDCDPGHDDAMAIALAGAHCELLGITTVSGNVSLANTTRNALTVCEVFGLDVEVHAGADRALNGDAPDASQIHGRTGLDGPSHPDHTRAAASDDGVGFMIETVRANAGCWLVPVGPLTNVALALRAAPDLLDSLAGISFMGGSVGSGNVTPSAEFNVWADPEAAAEVIACGHPNILMAGLKLTEQFRADDQFIAAIATLDTAHARWTADLLRFYLDSNEKVHGVRWGSIHDPCAILAVTHGELFESEELPVLVETDGTHTRGMTVVDQRRDPGAQPNVRVGQGIDGTVARRLLLDVLAAS